MSRLIARGGSPPTSLREEEMVRISALTSRVSTDGPRDNPVPGRSRSAPRRPITPSGPRLPSKTRFTSVSDPRSGERRTSSPPSTLYEMRREPTRTPPARPEFKARCLPDDDIERDHVGVHKTASVSTSYSQTAHYRPKEMQQPPITYERKDSVFSEQMELSPTIATEGMSFDPEQYQKHLNEIHQQATEYAKLQEGLMLLLPNIDGDQ